jgi:hypothetical protein
MLFKEIIALYTENHASPHNTHSYWMLKQMAHAVSTGGSGLNDTNLIPHSERNSEGSTESPSE